MPGTGDRFYVRKTTGDLVGPLALSAIAGLLKDGKLDGSEEVSPDRARWQPIAHVVPEAAELSQGAAAAAPSQEGGGAAGSWGERDLGDAGDLELAPLDSALGHGSPPPADHSPSVEPGTVSPPGLAPIDLSMLAPLELDESKPTTAAAPEAAPTTETAPEDQGFSGAQPLTLNETATAPAALAGAASRGGAGAAESAPPSGAPRLATGLEPPSRDGGAVPVDPGGIAGPDVAAAAGMAPDDVERAVAAIAERGRTLTAAKPKIEQPPQKSRRPLFIAVGAAVLVLGGGAAFFAFDLGDRLIGEPDPAAVLGDVARDIAGDQVAAYQRGATHLLDEASTRPKIAGLRAAAAELLASSVVLHRAERARLARAEAALAEIPTTRPPRPAVATMIVRARAWIALGKGRAREAGRLLEEGGAAAKEGAEGQLLAGWIDLGLRKLSGATGTFRQASTQFPDRVALLYSLGRAQEESGDVQAPATYRKVLAQAAGHFGAALGLIRSEHYPPAARLALASKLIADQGARATAAELGEAQALLARAQAATGKTTEAAATLEAALAKDPASPAALAAVGEALLAQGRLADAVAKFRLAVPSAPVIPAAVPAHELRFALAAVLIEGGNRGDGLAALGPPVPARDQASTEDPRALFWRGRAAELQTPPDIAAATQAYQQTLGIDPRFVPASLQLGALLLKQNRTADAVATLRRAQAAGAAAATLQVALGQALLGAGDVDRARKTFKEVLAQSPKDAAARLGLATALAAAHDNTGARRELEALLADSPDVPGLRPRLAELLISAGDREKAAALYQAEIDAGKASLSVRLAAAKLLFEMGRGPAALALLEKLTTEAPETPGALMWQGKVRLAGGDVAGALADLRRALSFESTPELHFEHGRALAAGGTEEKALSEFEQAGNMPAALVARGRLLLARGDTEHSVPLLEAALKQTPDNGEAWLLLGNGYDRMGVTPKAVIAWRAAARATPDNAEVHYHLGRWEMDQGQPGAAIGDLRQAAARAPAGVKWLTDLYFQLGFAEKAKGARPAAAAAWKKYLTLAAPDAPTRKEVEHQLAALGAGP